MASKRRKLSKEEKMERNRIRAHVRRNKVSAMVQQMNRCLFEDLEKLDKEQRRGEKILRNMAQAQNKMRSRLDRISRSHEEQTAILDNFTVQHIFSAYEHKRLKKENDTNAKYLPLYEKLQETLKKCLRERHEANRKCSRVIKECKDILTEASIDFEDF